MSFNVRGLGKKIKKNDVKQMIIQNGIDMCCIQESKIEKIEEKIVKELWFDRDFDWVWRESEGREGGIISIWNRKVFSKISLWHIHGMLVVNEIWLEDNALVMIINVYAPCNVSDKVQLWDAIKIILEQNEKVRTCIIGDFNSIRGENERIGKRGEVDQRDIRVLRNS
ncbi:hypothetical protein ACS0TY_029839 [Phlomoides rotata]